MFVSWHKDNPDTWSRFRFRDVFLFAGRCAAQIKIKATIKCRVKMFYYFTLCPSNDVSFDQENKQDVNEDVDVDAAGVFEVRKDNCQMVYCFCGCSVER